MLSPGFQTTVQDLGRFGYAHLGISASGAADALALRAGNLLVGNRANAAALEMTLSGATVEFERAAVVTITGADFAGDLPSWTPTPVKAGVPLRCGAAGSGARAYLCVRGGIDVPLLLGSASTHLLTGLGGYEGRALRRGDKLRVGEAAVRAPRHGPAPPPPVGAPGVLRVTAGPQADLFDDAFYTAAYTVSEASDRMGLRLRGPALRSPGTGSMITEGVAVGAVQVPPSGEPIILFVEHQTTGGYPKIANVISADLRAAGQLRPRDSVRFERTGMEQAWALLQEQEAWLHGLV